MIPLKIVLPTFSRDVRSFANLLKSSLGSGILAMPAAFKNAGTVVGIVGTIILGYICTHCVYLLVNMNYINYIMTFNLLFLFNLQSQFKKGYICIVS